MYSEPIKSFSFIENHTSRMPLFLFSLFVFYFAGAAFTGSLVCVYVIALVVHCYSMLRCFEKKIHFGRKTNTILMIYSELIHVAILSTFFANQMFGDYGCAYTTENYQLKSSKILTGKSRTDNYSKIKKNHFFFKFHFPANAICTRSHRVHSKFIYDWL